MWENVGLTQLDLLAAPKGADAAAGERSVPCGHDFRAEPTAAGFRGQDRRTEAKRSIDELVADALLYRTSAAFHEMITFVGKFGQYSPFNALLLHNQRPGTQFVAPASRWRVQYGRRIKPGSRPLIILQPRGPVMFVFDVSDTEALAGARPLPADVERPFDASVQLSESIWTRTVDNIKRDGIRVTMAPHGAHLAGNVTRRTDGPPQDFVTRRRPASRCRCRPTSRSRSTQPTTWRPAMPP
jgi:hypothetical protein